MRTLVLCLLPALAACSAMPNLSPPTAPAAPAMPDTQAAAAPALTAPERPDLGALLGGIRDSASAHAAKGPLEAATTQLQAALAGVGAKARVEGAANGSSDASGQARQRAADALASFGLGAGSLDTITKLLDDPAVKSALGPVLEQLRSLVATGG